MAKKKKHNKKKSNEFNNDPFKHLKGFAFTANSEEEEPIHVAAPRSDEPKSFSSEMEKLGVQRLDQNENEEEFSDFLAEEEPALIDAEELSDEELFLSALGELSVTFQDNIPPEVTPRQAEPRRMKQLKLGRISPDASLDLHGFKRADVAVKLSHFLTNSQHRGYSTLLVITGKGLHSEGGEAVLRDEAEHFLANCETGLVAEWGRAPKNYGGHGALVVFLKKK